MKEEASKVSPSVLLSIDDSDPAVCPALWEAVLYTVTTVEVCKAGHVALWKLLAFTLVFYLPCAIFERSLDGSI